MEHIRKVIVAAELMGVGVVNTFCGGDAAKTLDQTGRTRKRSGRTPSPSRRTTA